MKLKHKAKNIILALALAFNACSSQQETQQMAEDSGVARPLTIIAIGDAGESGRVLKSNASYITDMYTGAHDGGKFDAMIFLGDNFYNTGLNIPADDVEGEIKSILGRFKTPFEGLGRRNVHAITGNHDYYARNVVDVSFFFGLIDIETAPVGLTSKGNRREADIVYWTYYYSMPADAFYQLSPGSRDSVQFIFVDSALPLRTPPQSWSLALDSLRTLLAATRGRPGIMWRILVMHHPIYSVGQHGGYTEWNDETKTIEYLTTCDKDSNAVGWLKNWFDPEDLCTEKYQQYLDSLRSVITASQVRIQLALTGHDHSLQVLYYPDRDADCVGCPKVHVISGAGSIATRVKFPSPPFEFTSAQRNPKEEGESLSGFAQLRFEHERLRIVFYDGCRGELIDMGDGRKEFWIDVTGKLLNGSTDG
ncbi:MAG: metallophosphoesterase [Ignavibacteria bacterium]|nr:metallophosphoesterase [Ignavibacteria bacterium]